MSEAKHCLECGAELPADAPEGLCPRCLLRAGASPSSRAWTAPAPTELAPLFPQLEILELLGQGGMGAVYKARQPALDRVVALKVLPAEAGRDPAFAERFNREARALAKLSHPGIVAVYDFGQSGGLYYFVMEYVDGLNLRQVLRSGGLPPGEALKIVPQLCEALQYAHDEGVVHRDVKPENILLDRRGRVKVADFGIAKLLGRAPADFTLTGTQQVMGTPHYMAPEQLERPRDVDHRADIYSLGVVFYEMLTGELPLGRFAPPSRRVQVDVRLDEVVLRALEREPGRRYQHASEIGTEVESIAGSARPTTGPTAPAEPDRVLFRRFTGLTSFAVLLFNAVFITLEEGYLTGADWYSKKEMPYDWLQTWSIMFGALALFFGSYWYYLLMKRPEDPRSLQDFWRVWSTPDSRLLRAGKRLVVWFGVWWVLFLAAYVFTLTSPYEFAFLLVVHAGFLFGPFVIMAVLWRTVWGGERPDPGQQGPAARTTLPPLASGPTGSADPESSGTPAHRGPLGRFFRSPTAWAILLCVLGVVAGSLPWVEGQMLRLPEGTNAPYRWLVMAPANVFEMATWQGLTITAAFLVLGLFLLATASVPRLALARAVAILVGGAAVLVLAVLFIYHVIHGPAFWATPGSDGLTELVAAALSSKIRAQPSFGPYVVLALAVGLLVLGVFELRAYLLRPPDGSAGVGP